LNRPEGVMERVLQSVTTDNTDLVIVQQFLDGEAQGFDEIVRRYQSRVYNTCFQMLGNGSDAEDATQETFVAIFKGLGGFEARSTLSTWIYRITINKCRTFRSKRPSDVNVECDLSIHYDDHDGMQKRQVVRGLLQELKPHYRAVLILRYFQQLSYEEIGETLGWSTSKVKCYLSRARNHFKRAYQFLDGGDVDAMR